jgi:hypothetical protein
VHSIPTGHGGMGGQYGMVHVDPLGEQPTGISVGRDVGRGITVVRRIGVADGVPDAVTVIVVPDAPASAFAVFPSAATAVASVNCMDDCFAARTFIVQVPTISAPLKGLVGEAPRVTERTPFVWFSGIRTTGNTVPGVKLTMSRAAGS